jgi:hypothetical protein
VRGAPVSWEIKIWHEASDDRVSLYIESTVSVPDDVISHVTSVYWSDEVQGYADAGDDGGLPLDPNPTTRYQG